jgi:choline kinase
MHGIILAAGRGSRLKHLTEKKPKSFNKFGKKRYIDIIINNFFKNNIKNINIIVGYKKNFFNDYKYNKIYNSKWKSTNIFYSLNKANKILNSQTCLISYSDIIYHSDAIKLLIENEGDIVILNNLNWKTIWKLRFKEPLNDLENFNYVIKDKSKFLTKIGGKVKRISSINGQFAGLFKITPIGWKIIADFIKLNKINIDNIDITSFFSKFLKEKKNIIRVVDYSKHWFEIDSLEDVQKYMIYKKNTKF